MTTKKLRIFIFELKNISGPSWLSDPAPSPPAKRERKLEVEKSRKRENEPSAKREERETSNDSMLYANSDDSFNMSDYNEVGVFDKSINFKCGNQRSNRIFSRETSRSWIFVKRILFEIRFSKIMNRNFESS